MLLQILLCASSLVPHMLCVNSVPKAKRENLISLRDYEFVGEDKTLAAALEQRMTAALGSSLGRGSGVDEDELFTKQASPPIPSAAVAQPRLKVEPDLLPLNFISYPKVNISLDYAELFNISGDIKMHSNQTWVAELLGLDLAPAAAKSGRRLEYKDYDVKTLNMKILDIMKQNIYSVRNRLGEIDPMIQKYQKDVRFRMAFIFNRLDEWKHDIRTINHAMQLKRVNGFTIEVMVFYYSHTLRRNIDITYTVEFLIHLHSSYMKGINKIMPAEQRQQMKKGNELKEMEKIKQAAMAGKS